ncbi:hypothetical protein [Kribbella catacumbae]|nr:hypothetical protein [Kribbella catacumbae]
MKKHVIKQLAVGGLAVVAVAGIAGAAAAAANNIRLRLARIC